MWIITQNCGDIKDRMFCDLAVSVSWLKNNKKVQDGETFKIFWGWLPLFSKFKPPTIEPNIFIYCILFISFVGNWSCRGTIFFYDNGTKLHFLSTWNNVIQKKISKFGENIYFWISYCELYCAFYFLGFRKKVKPIYQKALPR